MTRADGIRSGFSCRPKDQALAAAQLVAVLMLLLTLAAVALVSAGAAHHEVAAEPSVSAPVSAFDASADDHDHGNEWTPTPGKRLRPMAGLTVLCALAAPAASTPPGGLVVPSPDERVPSASIEVLRV